MERIKPFSHNWLVALFDNRAFTANRDFIRGRVLDMGCGTCPYKEDILQTASSYTGIDWENSCHTSKNVDLFADLNEKLPFGDETAETVVAFQVLEHLKEPASFIAECYRILGNGGTILVTVPFMWRLHEQPYDYYRFTEYGLRFIFEKSGFKDIEIGKYCGFWPSWVLQFNYYTMRLAERCLKPLWQALWLCDQAIAMILDRLGPYQAQTTHYWVRAVK